MISEPPEYDPIVVWQNQVDLPAPTLDDVLARAHSFEVKNRRSEFIFWTALLLHLAVSLTEDFAGAKGHLWWVGAIRFALFTVWVMYIPFRIGDIDHSPLRIFGATGMTPVLDFYRKRLDRQRDYIRDDYKRQLIAIAVGFVLYCIFYPALFLVFGIPIAIAAAVHYRRKRSELPHIQRELDTLDQLRKESQ